MGFEPTTSAVTGRHSNQLNYQAINKALASLNSPHELKINDVKPFYEDR